MKTKKILLLTAATALMGGCSTTRPAAEGQAQRTEAVAATVDSRDYTVGMTSCHPLRMADRNLEYGYDIHVKGDTLFSTLPYFGRAWSIPYGGGSALRFKAAITAYETQQKKDGTRVDIRVNHDNDTYRYLLYIYDNGRASLDISCTNRDNISFTGTLDTHKEKPNHSR